MYNEDSTSEVILVKSFQPTRGVIYGGRRSLCVLCSTLGSNRSHYGGGSSILNSLADLFTSLSPSVYK